MPPTDPDDTSVSPAVAADLHARLAESDLDDAARAAVVDLLGTAPASTDGGDDDGDDATTAGVYLRSITVEGFRGIGPAATLDLTPAPGLTVVVGRNGSGKSSFAEGLELLMTGTTKRWDTQTKVWSSAWQCLHHDGPTRVAADLVVGGEDDAVSLSRTWERGAAYADDEGAADAIATLEARRWTAALDAYRPFLSYGELASMFDKLTSLYAALAPVLGLEDADALVRRAAEQRLALDKAIKAVDATRKELAPTLDPEDGRQAALAALLDPRRPDLDAVLAHLDAHPPGLSATDEASADLRARATRAVPEDEEVRDAAEALAAARSAESALATTDLDRARRLADLLAHAVALHDPAGPAEDCVVCGTPAVLDAAWRLRAEAEIATLAGRSSALADATRATAAAARAWDLVLHRTGAPADATVDDVLARAGDMRADAAVAREELDGADAGWKAIADATRAWVERVRDAAADVERLGALKAAEAWLKTASDALRNARFAPIAEQAVANWNALRHESNVELRDITLRTVGQSRQAIFDVRADGEEASALGVMSQGELLSLSVSVFLPRAGLDASPFRFAVIDDPVQSMDPAKVDGLARVLHVAAATRQVVVFTHDDRLPDAIRRLKLPAKVLQVRRRSRSRVDVREASSPLAQHLRDASRMAATDRLPEDVKKRVVPSLCRAAVEAACAEIVRTRAVRHGGDLAEANERLENARTLKGQIALALADDGEWTTEHADELRRRAGNDAMALVHALNSGAHGDYEGSLVELHVRTGELVRHLMP